MSSKIHDSGKINNEMSVQITKLNNSDTKNQVQESSNLVDEVLENVRKIDAETTEINDNVGNLKKRLNELDPEWDTKFGLAEENVAKSLINIREASNTWNINEKNINHQNEKFQKWNDSFALKLQELRDKITKAKHAAENVS
jgi:laminin alpha 1/2